MSDDWASFPVLSPEDVLRYLAHLNVDVVQFERDTVSGLPKPTFDLLKEIQLRHYYKKSFESLSIHIPENIDGIREEDPIPYQQGIGAVSVESSALLHKIVDLGRSGYCYELNGLLNLLLRALKFNVTTVVARVYAHPKADPAEKGYKWLHPCHQCSIVSFIEGQNQKRYHVEVAFGAGQPPFPLLLDEAADNGLYIYAPGKLPGVSKDVNLPPGYTISRRLDSGVISPLYHVIDQAVLPEDLKMQNFYECSFPDATFVKALVCSRARPDGRDSITYSGESEGALLTSTTSGTKSRRRITTFGEFKKILSEMFEIKL